MKRALLILALLVPHVVRAQVSPPPMRIQNAGTNLPIHFKINCTGALTCSDDAANGRTQFSASGASAPLTLTLTGVGSATTAGLTDTNTTAATSGQIQNGPSFLQTGQAWNTGAVASQENGWRQQPTSTNGNPPIAQLRWSTRKNGADTIAFDFSDNTPNQAATGLVFDPTIVQSQSAVFALEANGQSIWWNNYPAGNTNAAIGLTLRSTGEVRWTGNGGTPAWRTSADNVGTLGDLTHRWLGIFSNGPTSCKYNAQSGTTYTATTNDCIVAISNAAARTVTLPAANTMPAGGTFFVFDTNNNAGANNISVARTGTDTINTGTTTIAVVTANSAHSTCVTDGSSKWTCGINN